MFGSTRSGHDVLGVNLLRQFQSPFTTLLLVLSFRVRLILKHAILRRYLPPSLVHGWMYMNYSSQYETHHSLLSEGQGQLVQYGSGAIYSSNYFGDTAVCFKVVNYPS